MRESPSQLSASIREWGRELGFNAVGITGVDLAEEEALLLDWMAQGRHGEMAYFERHGAARARPQALVPGTVSVISVRLNYRPVGAKESWAVMRDPEAAFISRYALGRDYHKVMRQRLKKLAERIASEIGPFRHRAFADSAPVMEVALAQRAGLGWRGKHTLLLARDAGSFYFLGELYTDLNLDYDAPVEDHCGTCSRCIDVCPTQAIVAPYQLDARRCISYLTIELSGAIPVEFRPLIGNRVYGCDDCQLVCPWNKYAGDACVPDFSVRDGLDDVTLMRIFAWSEAEFLRHTEGSAIRRIGHERWRRNIAVALGNALRGEGLSATVRANIRAALAAARDQSTDLVREHIDWALAQTPPGDSP
ncbi:MAG: tRNA epoxyqueuosine(34) reductase QueG [Betaproteobacteria bacterium]|nr:tRNA epoxyqueuosine(34) reductase QueG [Betaproteobacteria bacterium]